MAHFNKMSIFPQGSFVFSQSSLMDYTECPRRFKLRYIDRLAWPTIRAINDDEISSLERDGHSFHKAVHQFFLHVPTRDITKAISSPKVLAWWKNFTEQAFPYTSWTTKPESTLVTHIAGHRLMAKFDLLITKDGKAIIFDWKTTQRKPYSKILEDRLQTRVYLTALIQAGSLFNQNCAYIPENVSMEYWFAEFPSEPIRIHYDKGKYENDVRHLTALIGEISMRQLFPLTDSQKICSRCSYRSYCNRDVTGEADYEPLPEDEELGYHLL